MASTPLEQHIQFMSPFSSVHFHSMCFEALLHGSHLESRLNELTTLSYERIFMEYSLSTLADAYA